MRKQKKHDNHQGLMAFLMVLILVASAVAYHFKNQSEVAASEPEIIVTLDPTSDSREHEIVRLNPDGSFQTIAKGWPPDISADGLMAYDAGTVAYVALVNNDGTIITPEIEVRDLETGELDPEFMEVIRHLENEGYHIWSPLWSPSGEKLAVFASHPMWDDIFTMFITRDYSTQISPPGWRPVGWYDDDQVIVDNARLRDEGPYTLMVMNEYAGWIIGQGYSIKGVVVSNGLILYDDYDPISGYTSIMSLRRGEATQPETAHTLITSTREGVFSPDGNQIAYLTDAGERPTSGGVWIANTDGNNARMVYRTDHVEAYHENLQWVGDRLYFITGINVSEGMDDTLVSIRSDGTDFMIHEISHQRSIYSFVVH